MFVSCFYFITNPHQDTYLIHKSFIMNYTSILSDRSVKESFEFELSVLIHRSLPQDCLYFELIGCCTGCRHKQVMVGTSFSYQTYGSVSWVQSSASYT